MKITKYEKKTAFFFRGHVGPLYKIQGYRGTNMSANADLITVETYVQQGKTIENQFFICGPKNIYIGLFEGPWGLNNQIWPILLSSYPLTHIYVHVK